MIDARRDGGSLPVFIRVGADGADARTWFFLDLADGTERAVKIGPNGWTVGSRRRIHFRRPDGLLALPMPRHDGSIDLLRPYVNLTDTDFRRAIVWLASALLPCGPHPVLILRGDEASGKTTMAKVFKLLVDPQLVPLLSVPASAIDLISASIDQWVLAFDDVNVMPAWLAKFLGEMLRNPNSARHPVLSAKEPSMSLGARPVILSGVDDVRELRDLNEFSIGVQLGPILFDDRRGEAEFWKAFQTDYPRILGGLLDVLTQSLSLARAERRSA